MNIKELFKSKRVGHIALEVRVRYQSIKSNKDLISDKVIVLLLHHILSGHICHCLGHILLIVHPETIIVCTCKPYIISYPNYGALQQPIACNSNLVKNEACAIVKQCEKTIKQDSIYLWPIWCPSGLSHTQKRRLQHLSKQETMEQQVEVKQIKPVAMKKVWRPKQIVSSST